MVDILYTIPNVDTAGSGAAVLNLARRLDRTRFRPALLVERRGGRLEDDFRAADVEIVEGSFQIPAKPYRSLLPRARRSASSLPAERFPIWHSFNYRDDYTEPIVARLGGARAWLYTKKNMSWNRRSWYLRSLLATRVLAQNSDMMRRFFSAPGLSRRAALVAPGIDLERFSPGVAPTAGWRRRLTIPEREVVVVTVAHLVPLKGHPVLLEALRHLPGVHALVAGRPLDEAYSERLHSIVRHADLTARVHFLDDVDDVPALLAEADIFVLPTRGEWGEGCPVALLEAMASGLASIASDVPGSRDVIEHDASGLLVRPDDPIALRQAIRQLLDAEERRRLGQAARGRIESGFGIDREVADHEALYAEIAERKGLWSPR